LENRMRYRRAHREITSGHYQWRELPSPPARNETVTRRSGFFLRKRQSRRRKPAFRTAPFRQWKGDSLSPSKSRNRSVGPGRRPIPAWSFRPSPCHPCPCRQSRSPGILPAANGNPRSPKRTCTTSRTPLPARTARTTAPQSNPPIVACSSCQFQSYAKGFRWCNLERLDALRHEPV